MLLKEKEPEIKKGSEFAARLPLMNVGGSFKMSDKIIAQFCLKSPYTNDKNVCPIRLHDAKSMPKPLERARKYRLTEIDKQEDSENWLIPYVISKQSIVVLYAPAGSGKTFAAWGLAKFSYLTQKVSEVFYFAGITAYRCSLDAELKNSRNILNLTISL